MRPLIFLYCITSVLWFSPSLYSQNYFPVQAGDEYIFNYHTYYYAGCGNPEITSTINTFTSLQSTHNGINYVSFSGKEYRYDATSNILYIYHPSGDKIAVDFNIISGTANLYYNQDSSQLYAIGLTYEYFAGMYRNIYSITYIYQWSDPNGFFWNSIKKYRFAEGIGEIEYYIYDHYYTAPPPWGSVTTRIKTRTLLSRTRNFVNQNFFNSPGLTASVPTGNTVVLNWQDKQVFEDGFELERKSPWDTEYISYASFPPDAVTFIDTVSPGQSYSYRMTTRWVNFYSCPDTVQVNTIAQPLNVTLEDLGGLAIKVDWVHNSDCDSFWVFRSFSTGNIWSDFTRISSVNGNTLTFTDQSLPAGYYYKYGICSYSGGLASPITASNPKYPSFSLLAPADFTVEVNNYEAVTLSWRDVNPYNNKMFKITRKCMDGGIIIPIVQDYTDTVYVDESISPNNTYVYIIKTVVGFTSSPVKRDTIDIPPFLPINPPGAVMAEILPDGSVLVNWTDNSLNEKYFDIGRGRTAGSIHIIDSVGYNISSYIDTDPVLTGTNQELYYSVRGRNPHSNSDWTVTIVTGINEPDVNKYSFELLQNHPNPFNPSTVIKFSIPEKQLVTLKIYDILGNEITTLVNETLSPGHYDINFNADGLASGVYIYRLSTESFTKSRKLLLMK